MTNPNTFKALSIAPIAYFSFDGTNENGEFIESQSNKPCTAVGTPLLKKGRNGNALYLDGNSYLKLDMELPKPDRPHSVAAWVKIDTENSNSSGTHFMVCWGSYRRAYESTLMMIHKGNFHVCTRGKNSCNTLSEKDREAWHHFAYTYENRHYTVYMDGEVIAVLDLERDLSVTDSPLFIGGIDDLNFGFPGYIDDLFVFDKAISHEDIWKCMNISEEISAIEPKSIKTYSLVPFERMTGTVVGEKYCSGFEYMYTVSVPQFDDAKEYALVLSFDGHNGDVAQVMADLHEAGVTPPAITLGISSGMMRSTISPDYDVNVRQFSYDVFSAEFANFVVEELIPKVTEMHGLRISSSPDMHMTTGGSSAGICAWNFAWFRNDYFHRMYMSSPTFSAMTKGFIAPVYMRLYETKTIRGYMDYSEHEPNAYFGSSYLAAKFAESAIEYAGYQIGMAYHEGEGHCSRRHDQRGLTEVMKYVWESWDTVPVSPVRNTPYLDRILSISEKWTPTKEAMPTKFRALAANGEYTFKAGSIYFTSESGKKRRVATGFPKISSIAVSSDTWRLYIACESVGSVYAMIIEKNGSLRDKFLLASLYTNTDFTYPGATQLCIDCQDRVYAVTEMGIQVIRSYGPIEAILLLPDGKIPEEIAFGDKDNTYMYAKCGDTVYKRLFKVAGRAGETTEQAATTRTYY